jgi:hypothetical protein
MLALKRTIENTHATPNENSATQNKENGENNEEEENLSQETRARIKTTLKKPRQPKKTNPKLAAGILRDFATQLSGNQKKVMLGIAKKTAKVQDFGTTELSKTYKMSIYYVYNVLKPLLASLEKLGLRKIQTTEVKKHGHRNHYLITKPINNPSEKPKKTNRSEIQNGRTQYEKVTRNLDFIPDKFHDVLLFLALSSKHRNWINYDEIAEGIKKHRDTVFAQIKSLKELLPKIGVELLEEKTNKGKKYFHLTKPGKNHDEREKFQEKKKERKNLSGDHVAKMRQRHKIRTISTSAVIKKNRPKREPPDELDEWYDDDFQPPLRKLWEDASGKGGSV